jgi:hypothetical protein
MADIGALSAAEWTALIVLRGRGALISTASSRTYYTQKSLRYDRILTQFVVHNSPNNSITYCPQINFYARGKAQESRGRCKRD